MVPDVPMRVDREKHTLVLSEVAVSTTNLGRQLSRRWLTELLEVLLRQIISARKGQSRTFSSALVHKDIRRKAHLEAYPDNMICHGPTPTSFLDQVA